MPEKILSLDLATVIGWCLGDGDGDPLWGTHRLPSSGDDAGAYGLAFHRWLLPILREHKPTLVVFEAPLKQSGGLTTNYATIYKLYGLAFYTETLCRLLDIRPFQVDAPRWKKGVCGTGRVSKSQRPYPPTVALAQRGWDVKDNNAADAVCIWLFALACTDQEIAARFDPLARTALAV